MTDDQTIAFGELVRALRYAADRAKKADVISVSHCVLTDIRPTIHVRSIDDLRRVAHDVKMSRHSETSMIAEADVGGVRVFTVIIDER